MEDHRRQAAQPCGYAVSKVPPHLPRGVEGLDSGDGPCPLLAGSRYLIFIIAAISQAVSARLAARRSVTAGLPLLLICLAMLEAALFAKALWLFLAGTVIGGVAVGFVFRGGLSELNRLVDPRHRAGVVSTFFAAAYLGLGLTAVLTAVLTGLISPLTGTVDASAYTSGLVAAVVVAAFAVVRRTYGTAPAPQSPCTPSDSWCSPQEPASGSAVPIGRLCEEPPDRVRR
jgi:MFS family permease